MLLVFDVVEQGKVPTPFKYTATFGLILPSQLLLLGVEGKIVLLWVMCIPTLTHYYIIRAILISHLIAFQKYG
jgi:hypothetical protein